MTDHLIIDARSQPPQIRCLHCGFAQDLRLPMAIRELAALELRFSAEHRGCKPPPPTPLQPWSDVASYAHAAMRLWEQQATTTNTTSTMSDNTIPNRDAQHGGMEPVGNVSQTIKAALRRGDNWSSLTPGEREALDMIAHKFGRILSGADPRDAEHWVDVAGYAMAATRID